ncbi:hypothetical protein YWIDRAFT_00357 [Streptomyces sp. SceaMP-e96]|nr:hypothetical protein YWIDRAFT_00357 [Streptomyces sp. SceaMP-e96]
MVLVVLEDCLCADRAVEVTQEVAPDRDLQASPGPRTDHGAHGRVGVGSQRGHGARRKSGQTDGLFADRCVRVCGELFMDGLGELCAPVRRERREDPSAPGVLLAEDQTGPLLSSDVRLGLGQQLPHLPLRVDHRRLHYGGGQAAPQKEVRQTQQPRAYVLGRGRVECQSMRPQLAQPARRTRPLKQRCPGGGPLLRGLLSLGPRGSLLPLLDPVHGDEPDLVFLGGRPEQGVAVRREREEFRLARPLPQHTGKVPSGGEPDARPAPGHASGPVAGDIDEEHTVLTDDPFLDREPVPLSVELGDQVRSVDAHSHSRLGFEGNHWTPRGPGRQYLFGAPVPHDVQPGTPQQFHELVTPTRHGNPSCLDAVPDRSAAHVAGSAGLLALRPSRPSASAAASTRTRPVLRPKTRRAPRRRQERRCLGRPGEPSPASSRQSSRVWTLG